MSHYHHPASHDLSPGSLRVWLLVGVALVFLGLAAVRPLLSEMEMRTRLAVAEQSLVTYRGAVLAYYSENSNVVNDAVPTQPQRGKPDANGKTPEEASTDSVLVESGPNLGERLLAEKKLDQITFPLGERDRVPANGEDLTWQPNRPEIRAVNLSVLASHFNHPKLFPSSRSGRVAVLVVPFLREREAEAIQKMLGGIHQKEESRSVSKADCFFTRSSVEGKFNGWIYLSDL